MSDTVDTFQLALQRINHHCEEVKRHCGRLRIVLAAARRKERRRAARKRKTRR